MSPAESLWIARAPISNPMLVIYRIASIVPSTLIKTILVATVLFCDVVSPLRLVFALLIAMIILEGIRMIADRVASALSPSGRIAVRAIVTTIAVLILIQLAARTIAAAAGLLHVAAWLAVCTLLLAPPALRIDFRRDIDRIWLLKSLPITPLAMTIGQIVLPSIMVRAKLVFLGKGLLLAMIGVAFIAWVMHCAKVELSVFVLIAGCIIASWSSAAAAIAVTSRCWRRFDGCHVV